MPIYYYRCDDCGVEFERRQRMSDEAIEVCPECSGSVRRVIQPVGVIFKGSGFYITDNRQVSSPTLTPPKEGGEGEGEKKAAEEPATSDTSSSQEPSVSQDTSSSSESSASQAEPGA